MGRRLFRLTPKQVQSKTRPGLYPDGGNLYLQVTEAKPENGRPRVTKSWIFRYARGGADRWMGLGPLDTISLKSARERAQRCREQLVDGIDPIDARDTEQARRIAEQAKVKTFSECATAYIAAHRHDWKNAKHVEQWRSTIKTYCDPVFGKVPVHMIDTPLVLKVLEPIWTKMPETASRLRGRIERILTWAAVQKLRSGDNPARWHGHLKELLPTLEKRKRVKHHAALPYQRIGEFMEKLRAMTGATPRALEFTILTAARTSEVIAAEPGEIDIKAAVWTVPAKRMKAHREHRVPLSPRAIEIVRGRLDDEWIFPGAKDGGHLSNMAMLKTLERMGYGDFTVHGFRSTFRDWAAEQTNFPREVCEMALAHTIKDTTEAAYRRGDLFEKRRELMMHWARFCSQKPAKGEKVTPIRKAS